MSWDQAIRNAKLEDQRLNLHARIAKDEVRRAFDHIAWRLLGIEFVVLAQLLLTIYLVFGGCQ